jgi:hypothetical protein
VETDPRYRRSTTESIDDFAARATQRGGRSPHRDARATAVNGRYADYEGLLDDIVVESIQVSRDRPNSDDDV